MIKGEDLQVGAVYEFSDDPDFHKDATLTYRFEEVLQDDCPYNYKAYNGGMWKYIRYCQAPIAKPKPVFTQEMADRKELPPVGAHCQYETDFFSMDKFNNGACRPIAYFNGRVWIDIDGGRESVINLSSIKFKPIKTDREKVIELIASVFGKHGGVVNDLSIGQLIDTGLINEDKILKGE